MSEQEIIEPSTALVVTENKNHALTFVPNGLDPILEKIKENTRKRAAELDISTPKGRQAIISLSVEVRDEKTALEKIRVNLVAEKKRALTLVDEEAGRAWDELEKLQKEIRQPVTDWENKDKARIAAHELALAEIVNIKELFREPKPAEFIRGYIDGFPNRVNREWEEFAQRAVKESEDVEKFLHAQLEATIKAEKDAAELAAFRAEEERLTKIFQDMYQEAHEENVAFNARVAAEKKAADDARIAAEKAAKEKQKIIDDAKAAADKAAADKATADKALVDAENKRVADLAAAAEKAEKDKAAALKKQQDAAAQAKADEEAATRKREADQAHKKKINNEILSALGNINLSQEGEVGESYMKDHVAKFIITAIAKGEIPHVKINY